MADALFEERLEVLNRFLSRRAALGKQHYDKRVAPLLADPESRENGKAAMALVANYFTHYHDLNQYVRWNQMLTSAGLAPAVSDTDWHTLAAALGKPADTAKELLVQEAVRRAQINGGGSAPQRTKAERRSD